MRVAVARRMCVPIFNQTFIHQVFHFLMNAGGILFPQF